jgi:hypothetical protein
MESAKQTVFTEPEYLLHRLDYPKATEAEKLELVEAFRNAIIAATEAKVREEYAGVGVGLIASERKRQVEVEKWSSEHDDEHDKCELWRAARSYLVFAYAGERDDIPVGWPWDEDDWNPSEDPIRNLVKAGALIAAEIDRVTRKAALDKVSQ